MPNGTATIIPARPAKQVTLVDTRWGDVLTVTALETPQGNYSFTLGRVTHILTPDGLILAAVPQSGAAPDQWRPVPHLVLRASSAA